jgi:hypothetical protein
MIAVDTLFGGLSGLIILVFVLWLLFGRGR